MAKNGNSKKSSPSDKAQHSAYKIRNTHEKNKIARLERVVRTQPNNVAAAAALENILKKGASYTRNRRSAGHVCKGLYKELGFKDNRPNDKMLKSKLDLRKFFGIELKFSPSLPKPE